jgi:hypothetical protein
MTPATDTVTWVDANQQHLVAALGRVRSALEQHAARAKAGDSSSPPLSSSGAALTAPASGPPMALDVLAAAFELSPFERDVVVMCAGLELDGSLGALCALAQGSSQRPYPTFGLALAALPDAHWSAIAPTAPLRHWRLIDVTPGAHAALEEAGQTADEFIMRHANGDWGEIGTGVLKDNQVSLREGFRIFSTYYLNTGVKIQIFTEEDRSFTQVLLPEEF